MPEDSRSSGGCSVQGCLHRINNFLHLPVVYEVWWYMHYTGLLLISPLLVPLMLLGFIYDLVTLRLFSFRMTDPEGRAVLVTGCDSGFGLQVAQSLASKGWKVYAGCLTPKGVEELREFAPGVLVPLLLDVTKQEQINDVMAHIAAEEPHGLYALVNNAGVGVGAAVDWVPTSTFRFVMDVNFFGTVAMCQSALPLLKQSAREGRGARIVNVSSIAGLYSSAQLLAPYAASKHATEAFSRTLAVELEQLGISVHILNPTFHATSMANSGEQIRRTFAEMPMAKQAEYGQEHLEEMLRLTEDLQGMAWQTHNVERGIVHAVAGEKPKAQYILGLDGLLYLAPLTMAPLAVHRIITRLVARPYRLELANKHLEPEAYDDGEAKDCQV